MFMRSMNPRGLVEAGVDGTAATLFELRWPLMSSLFGACVGSSALAAPNEKKSLAWSAKDGLDGVAGETLREPPALTGVNGPGAMYILSIVSQYPAANRKGFGL